MHHSKRGNIEELYELLKNKEEVVARRDYINWLHLTYANIVRDYITRTTAIEADMNYLIAAHFTDKKALCDELVNEVILRMNFKVKFVVFEKMMRRYHKKEYEQYKEKIEIFRQLYELRNKLAHSFIHVGGKVLTTKSKKRIWYINPSAPQPQSIELSKYEKDNDYLIILELDFADLLFTLTGLG